MSVKIRLNNKKFLGEGLLIGSRLNEGEVTTNQQQQQTTVQPQAQPTYVQPQQQAAQPKQPQQPTQYQPQQQTVQPQQQQQATQNTSTANTSVGNIYTQLDQIIATSFIDLAKNVADKISSIKLAENMNWVAVPNINTVNCATVIPEIQKFLQGNIAKAKEFVQKQAEAAKTNNASSGNASTSQ